jgi:hypothetical protein
MGTNIRAVIAATMLALLLLPRPVLAEQHLLRDPDIMALMNGATLALTDIGGSNVVLHHLQPISRTSEHGKTDVIMPKAYDVERGIWWVEEDQFCVLYHHIVTVRKRCFAVAQDGAETRFIETRYEMPGHKVVRPNQLAATAMLSRPAQGTGAYQLLDDAGLVALLNNTYLDIKMPDTAAEIVIQFTAVGKPGDHGKMYSHPLSGRGIQSGTWWVEDEQFCVFWDHMIGIRKRCFSVARDGSDLRFIETRWEQPGRVIQRDHQWVPSAQLFREYR